MKETYTLIELELIDLENLWNNVKQELDLV